MSGRTRTFRFVRALIVVVVVAAMPMLLLLARISAGELRTAFLDAPVATALAGLAPDLVAEVGATGLVQSGRGIALRVSGLRLLSRDGTVLLTLPELSVRPSFGALVRGRFVIARVDVSAADLALARRPDGTLMLGAEAPGGGVPLRDFLATPATPRQGALPLPRLALTRTRVTLTDEAAGITLVLANGDLTFTARSDGVSLTLTADLDLTLAPSRAARGQALGQGALRLPIRATAAAARMADGKLGEITFALAGESGEIVPPGAAGPPLPVRAVAATGTHLPEVQTTRFAHLGAEIGASKLDAHATLIHRAPALLAFAGTVDALPVATLMRLWPADAAAAARAWLAANVRTGGLRSCRVQLGLHASGAAEPSSPDAIDVTCDFTGVTADYLPPLAPIRDAAGTAHLTTERLAVDVRSGMVAASRVEGGTLAMDLTVDPPRATIVADVAGTTADVLALVDAPPLALVTPLGIVPQDVSGESRVHAELALPIKSGLTRAEITVRATAALRATRVPQLVGGVGIADGALDVRIDGARLGLTGTTTLTGLPAVSTPVRIGLHLLPGARSAEQQGRLALDGDGVVVRATARLTGSMPTAVAVERLQIGSSDVTGTLARQPNGTYAGSLAGASLDLEPLLADARLGSGAAALSDVPAFTLAVQLGRLRRSKDLEVRNLRGSLQGAGGRLTALALTGSLVPSGNFQATLTAGTGARRLTITSDQAGRTLQAATGQPQIVGGTLALDATTDARGPLAFLDGTLVLRNFKVVRAPVLAKVLGLGSLDGIAALVQGEGLPVSEAHVPLRWDGVRLTFQNVRAIGAVGLTADGVLEPKAGTCDFSGNVIPAYSLNSALGKVPLLGRLFVGAKGDGVFGIDYRVRGKIADPTVRVNPLTSIAPTVLRTWFVDPFTRAVRGPGRRHTE